MRRSVLLCLLLIAGGILSPPLARAQLAGLYQPAEAGRGPSVDGSLRLCPIDTTRLAYDLRLGPAPADAGEADGSGDGCVGVGILEAGASGFQHAGDDFHLVIRPDGTDRLRLASIAAGGAVCTRDGLPDGVWLRIGGCDTWRPLEIEQTQIMLRDLGLLDIPVERPAAPVFEALLAVLAPELPEAAPQAIATLVRLRWRAECAVGTACRR